MIIEQFAAFAQPVLRTTIVRRTRRNHGLEHATIHILASRIPNLRMAGRSSENGFVLLGEAPQEMVEKAAHDALRRMQRGEHQLAIHPNCGTNLVTTGFMATVAAMFGLIGSRRRDMFDRLPAVMSLVMLTLLIAPGVGTSLQKHITTDGDPADLEIISIARSRVQMPFGGEPVTVHRVVTRSS